MSKGSDLSHADRLLKFLGYLDNSYSFLPPTTVCLLKNKQNETELQPI